MINTFFEPIYRGARDMRGFVEIGRTSYPDLVSVRVEDHSSTIHDPQALWTHLDRTQVRDLHWSLGKWLNEPIPGPPAEV
jgi:hypothetical protein